MAILACATYYAFHNYVRVVWVSSEGNLIFTAIIHYFTLEYQKFNIHQKALTYAKWKFWNHELTGRKKVLCEPMNLFQAAALLAIVFQEWKVWEYHQKT